MTKRLGQKNPNILFKLYYLEAPIDKTSSFCFNVLSALHGTIPLKKKDWRNPVYCSWCTNNPPPYFRLLFFSCFYAYFRLGQVKLRLGLPRRVRKEVQLEPCRVSPPIGARIRKKRKIKNKEGGDYLCSKNKTLENIFPFLYYEDTPPPLRRLRSSNYQQILSPLLKQTKR